jgi:hypothetical protein
MYETALAGPEAVPATARGSPLAAPDRQVGMADGGVHRPPAAEAALGYRFAVARYLFT